MTEPAERVRRATSSTLLRVARHPQHAAEAPEHTRADAGVEGNARLTASNGLLLTVLLLVEGVTILDVRGMITLHTVIGLMLIGPVLLKCASTVYRFARYYSGKPAYVRKGPPHVILRVIGPLVILSSIAVIGTGVGLLAVHGRGDTLITLHQASFIVWVALMTVHVLGHIIEAATNTTRDLRRGAGRGRSARLLAVGAALVVGVAVAAAFTPSASSWQLHHGDHRPGSARH